MSLPARLGSGAYFILECLPAASRPPSPRGTDGRLTARVTRPSRFLFPSPAGVAVTLFRKGLILLSIPLLTQAAYVGMAVGLRADIPDDGQPRVVTLLVATVAAGVLTTGLVAWLFWQGVVRGSRR